MKAAKQNIVNKNIPEIADTGQENKKVVIDRENASICISQPKDIVLRRKLPTMLVKVPKTNITAKYAIFHVI